MRVLSKILFFSFCFITGLFSLPDLLADDKCISASGRISAHAFVANPVGIFNQSQSELIKKPMVLRVPEKHTVVISMNDFSESYSSDSTVSLISLDNFINDYQYKNQPCTLTVFFPHQ